MNREYINVVSFTGYSGAGKTHIICGILKYLCNKGISVAVIKHTHHKINIDDEKKDTYKYLLNGSVFSVIVSDGEIYIKEDINSVYIRKESIVEIPCKTDLFIVEGFSNSNLNGFEIVSDKSYRESRLIRRKNKPIALILNGDNVLKQDNKYNNLGFETIKHSEIGYICKYIIDALQAGEFRVKISYIESLIKGKESFK